MSEPLNPYAVAPPSDVSVNHPIRFGGTLTRDDWLISVRDAPPNSGWSRLKFPFILIVIVALIAMLNNTAFADPRTLSIWPVLAYPLLPAWLWLVRLVTPFLRRRLRRAEESAKHCTPNRGWMDEEHFVVYDTETFLRAKWNFFGPAYVFDAHLLLPLAADATHRIVLPFRFFTSPADVKHVLEMVGEKIGVLVNSPPKDHTLAAQIEMSDDETDGYSMEQTLAWNSSQWPFEASDEGEHDFAIDLTAGQQGWRFSLAALMNIILFAVWYFLPIWVGTIAWLALNYFGSGDWSFLLDHATATGIIVGPAAFILALFLYNAFSSMLLIRRTRSQPLSIRIRPAGIHLSHEAFQSWFRWSVVEEIFSDANHAGWVVKENKDKAKFPRTCFGTDQDFHRFQEVLRRFKTSVQE